MNTLVDYWPITHVMEWYVQDSWKVSKRLTLEYGVRFSWDMPTYLKNDEGGNFDFSKYNRSKAPAMYAPAKDAKGARVAQNPLTGELLPSAYIGRFVPNSGDPTIGSVKAGTAGYPRGFMQSNGLVPGPRFGLAYDPFGDGKTAIRAGAGIFINARPRSGQTGDMAFNPPVQLVPVQYYGNVATFLNASGTLAPSNANKVLQTDAKLISAYNLTFGIQRNIGWNTVLDVAYVGNMGRHLGQTIQMNTLPYGAQVPAAEPGPDHQLSPAGRVSAAVLRLRQPALRRVRRQRPATTRSRRRSGTPSRAASSSTAPGPGGRP